MDTTVTLTQEEHEVILFALGVMLGHVGTTAEGLATVQRIMQKLAEGAGDE